MLSNFVSLEFGLDFLDARFFPVANLFPTDGTSRGIKEMTTGWRPFFPQPVKSVLSKAAKLPACRQPGHDADDRPAEHQPRRIDPKAK